MFKLAIVLATSVIVLGILVRAPASASPPATGPDVLYWGPQTPVDGPMELTARTDIVRGSGGVYVWVIMKVTWEGQPLAGVTVHCGAGNLGSRDAVTGPTGETAFEPANPTGTSGCPPHVIGNANRTIPVSLLMGGTATYQGRSVGIDRAVQVY